MSKLFAVLMALLLACSAFCTPITKAHGLGWNSTVRGPVAHGKDSVSVPEIFKGMLTELDAKDGWHHRSDCLRDSDRITCRLWTPSSPDTVEQNNAVQTYMTDKDAVKYFRKVASGKQDLRPATGEGCGPVETLQFYEFAHTKLCDCFSWGNVSDQFCPVYALTREQAIKTLELSDEPIEESVDETRLAARNVVQYRSGTNVTFIEQLKKKAGPYERFDCAEWKTGQIICSFLTPETEIGLERFVTEAGKLNYYRQITGPGSPDTKGPKEACPGKKPEFTELCACFTWQSEQYCPVAEPTEEEAQRFVAETLAKNSSSVTTGDLYDVRSS